MGAAVRAILLKDLTIRLRDPAGLVLMFAVPLLVITIASFALSPLYSRGAGRLRLPLVDLDGGATGDAVAKQLSGVPGLELERATDAARVRAQIREGERFGALVVPAGASAARQRGEPVSLTMLHDPGDPAMTALLNAIIGGAAASLACDSRAPAVAVRPESVIPRLKRDVTPFQQNVPGVAVTFALLMTISAGLSLMRERRGGTLRRIMLAPVSRAAVLLGKLLPVFLLTFAQLVVLLGFGHLVLGVSLGDSPGALLLVVVSLALAPPALGLMAAALVRSEAQLLSLSILIIMVMSALGGSWWPLELVPDTLRSAAYVLTINAWAMDGLKDILWYGRGLADVLPEVAVLLGVSAAALALGAWRFRWS